MNDVLRRRAQRWAGGLEIFHALDAALDRALHLGLDPLGDGGEIEARRRVHFCSPDGGGRLWRGGGGRPACADIPPEAAFNRRSIALISLSWPSIDCSRSAMPIIWARLGRFIERRYFSMNSANCFCAPAEAPPAWFIALENPG